MISSVIANLCEKDFCKVFKYLLFSNAKGSTRKGFSKLWEKSVPVVVSLKHQEKNKVCVQVRMLWVWLIFLPAYAVFVLFVSEPRQACRKNSRMVFKANELYDLGYRKIPGRIYRLCASLKQNCHDEQKEIFYLIIECIQTFYPKP